MRVQSYFILMLLAIALGWNALAHGDTDPIFNRKPNLAEDVRLPAMEALAPPVIMSGSV